MIGTGHEPVLRGCLWPSDHGSRRLQLAARTAPTPGSGTEKLIVRGPKIKRLNHLLLDNVDKPLNRSPHQQHVMISELSPGGLEII